MLAKLCSRKILKATFFTYDTLFHRFLLPVSLLDRSAFMRYPVLSFSPFHKNPFPHKLRSHSYAQFPTPQSGKKSYAPDRKKS